MVTTSFMLSLMFSHKNKKAGRPKIIFFGSPAVFWLIPVRPAAFRPHLSMGLALL